ncbi:MAG: hypothetical protein KIT42_06810 [Rhodocyclaceae bacterium]|nr:hypothetical protein [Rhodocyclaceae bacterium]
MSTEQSEKGPDVFKNTVTTESTTSNLDELRWKLLRWWGVLFRTLFICAIGVIGWFWIDPQSISEIPLSQLTLKQISGNISAFLLAIFCATWFFEFPEQDCGEEPRDNPYVGWGQFGGWIVGVAVLAVYWLNK